MKHYYFGILLVLFTITVNGQSKKEINLTLSLIENQEQFEKYQFENSDSNIENIELNISDSEFPKKLKKLKKGKTRFIKKDGIKYYYKLINISKETEFRASYIYLNGNELTKKEIDSIRTIIIEKLQSGVSFANLVEEYNMDGNSTQGDLGWFKKGIMVPDFEKAVIEHKKNDIFTVDINSRKWYYVVLKTYDDRIIEKRNYIRIKSSS